MTTEPTTVAEFRIDASKDGQWMVIHFRDPNGAETSYQIAMQHSATWVGKQLDQMSRVGKDLPAAPDGTPRIIPHDQHYPTFPVRVGLNRTESEPILVLDYGVAALGCVIDRESITHVLSKLIEHFPVTKH